MSSKQSMEQNYLSCQVYREQVGQFDSQLPGFVRFAHDNGKYYFAMMDSGNIIFRSKAYSTVEDREDGIKAVIRNKDNIARYSVLLDQGTYFTILKADNNMEIARSCPMVSEEAARVIWPDAFRAASHSDYSNNKEESHCVFSNAESIHANHIDLESKYLHCREYCGHPLADKLNRVSFFKFANEFYFAICKEDGTVRLRSEGFSKKEIRDSQLSEVLRLFNVEENYSVLRNGDLYIKILKNEKGREIARTCIENDSPENLFAQSLIFEESAAASTKTSFLGDKAGKYLNCNYYIGHPLSDKQNKVAFFQHEGRYYFAIYYSDGRVRLRSEGFESSKERETYLKEVLRYLDNKDQYSVLRDGDQQVRILNNKEDKEIGRTCLEKVNSLSNRDVTPKDKNILNG